jgi:hypothetical protein
MARDLRIQIRLTKEEHDAIAAQARRQGLGIGTYLRALALWNAVELTGTPRGRALASLNRAQERARGRGLDRLSAKDIDAEIKAARATRSRSR